MSIILLTIPETSADWPEWLDQQLMGSTLVHLIDELQLLSSTVAPKASDSAADQNQTEATTSEVTLADIADAEQLNQVLESGTSAFTINQFQLLFGHPELLLDLQQRILESGGEFWRRFELPTEMQAMSGRILQKLDLRESPRSSNARPASPGGAASTAGPQGDRRKLMWLASSLVAVLLLIGMLQLMPEVAQPAGLSNPALFTAEVQSAQEWFDLVAAAGQTWQTEQHLDAEQLLQALSETSEACDRLIANPHPVLNSAQQTWFVTKCQNWKTKLDETHAALSAGELSFQEAKAQADGIMSKLVTVLQAGPAPEDLQAALRRSTAIVL